MPSNRSEAVRAPEDGVLRPNAIVFGMAVGVPTADHFRRGMEIFPPAVMIAWHTGAAGSERA